MHLDDLDEVRYVERSMHFSADGCMTWFVARLDDNLPKYQTNLLQFVGNQIFIIKSYFSDLRKDLPVM